MHAYGVENYFPRTDWEQIVLPKQGETDREENHYNITNPS